MLYFVFFFTANFCEGLIKKNLWVISHLKCEPIKSITDLKRWTEKRIKNCHMNNLRFLSWNAIALQKYMTPKLVTLSIILRNYKNIEISRPCGNLIHQPLYRKSPLDASKWYFPHISFHQLNVFYEGQLC